MPGSAYPLRMLQTISGHLRERGFRGNSEDYYDPGKGRGRAVVHASAAGAGFRGTARTNAIMVRGCRRGAAPQQEECCAAPASVSGSRHGCPVVLQLGSRRPQAREFADLARVCLPPICRQQLHQQGAWCARPLSLPHKRACPRATCLQTTAASTRFWSGAPASPSPCPSCTWRCEGFEW